MADLYSEVDLPHKPNEHIDWQESWVLIFRDYDTNLVGFVRLGAYVNQKSTQTHWGMAMPDGLRFRRHTLARPLEAGDRTDLSASSGALNFSIPNFEYCRFHGSYDDAECDLRIYDFFPSQEREWVGGANHGKPAGDNITGHPESAGRVEGRVRIGDRVVEISNGIGYRDHSFGVRSFPQPFRSMRWNAGTVGPALSWSLMTGQSGNGEHFKRGWLIRDGQRLPIKDIHNVNITLGDGISVLGGWGIAELENGERICIDLQSVDNVVTSSHFPNGGPGSTPAGVEALSITRWNGYEGVADFNMIDNAHRGEQPVSNLLFSIDSDGVTHREFDPTFLRQTISGAPWR